MNRWLVVFDLDRTLTNDSVVTAALEQACRTVGIETSSMLPAKQQAEVRGETFQELAYLHSKHPSEQIDAMKASFLGSARPDELLYLDVEPVLTSLSVRKVPFIILTYGEPEWQQLKLTATGLSRYHTLITDTKKKGPLITGWRQGNAYVPPVWDKADAASGVLLVDDKAVSFADLPADCYGAWLRRPDEPLLASQDGVVPQHVTTIGGLDECLKLLEIS